MEANISPKVVHIELALCLALIGFSKCVCIAPPPYDFRAIDMSSNIEVLECFVYCGKVRKPIFRSDRCSNLSVHAESPLSDELAPLK